MLFRSLVFPNGTLPGRGADVDHRRPLRLARAALDRGRGPGSMDQSKEKQLCRRLQQGHVHQQGMLSPSPLALSHSSHPHDILCILEDGALSSTTRLCRPRRRRGPVVRKPAADEARVGRQARDPIHQAGARCPRLHSDLASCVGSRAHDTLHRSRTGWCSARTEACAARRCCA